MATPQQYHATFEFNPDARAVLDDLIERFGGPSFAPDFDAHDYRDDVEADEASGTGYTAGGASVSVSIGAFNTTTNKWTVTLGSKVFTAATITARYAAYYKRRGGASTADELIGLNDFGSNVASTAGDFTVNASTFEIELNAA